MLSFLNLKFSATKMDDTNLIFTLLWGHVASLDNSQDVRDNVGAFAADIQGGKGRSRHTVDVKYDKELSNCLYLVITNS